MDWKDTLKDKKALSLIVIIGLAFGLLLFSLYLILVRNSGTNPTTAKAQIAITASGFEPATLTIKKGTRVIWLNQDTKLHKVASDPFPNDSDLPLLNSANPLGAAEGQYNYTFNTKGEFKYHDDLNPAMGGTVVVE